MAGAYALVLLSLPVAAADPGDAGDRGRARPRDGAGRLPARQGRRRRDAADHVVRAQLPAPERRRARLGIAAADDRLRVRSRAARSTLGAVTIQKLDLVIIGVTLVAARLRSASSSRGRRSAPRCAPRPRIFRMARVLGIRANMVVAAAFALSGLLAAAAAILLTAQTGSVSPTIGLSIVLFAFIATIVGGMGSLPGAVLGGFLDRCPDGRPAGDRSRSISGRTATRSSSPPCSPSSSSGRRGSFPRARRSRESSRGEQACGMCSGDLRRRPARRSLVASDGAGDAGRRALGAFLAESVWPLARAHGAGLRRRARRVRPRPGLARPDRRRMVINLIVVVGLYTFVGVSGVFSFGHAAFMAIGAYAGAILVIPPETKRFVLPELPGFLARRAPRPLPGDDRCRRDGRRGRARALRSARSSLRAHGGTGDLRRPRHRERRRAELGAGDARHGRRVRDSDDDDDLGSARLGPGRDGRGVGVSAIADRPAAAGARGRTRRRRARSAWRSAASATIAFVLSAFFAGSRARSSGCSSGRSIPTRSSSTSPS